MTIFFGQLCIKIAFIASLIQTLGVVPGSIAKLARPACQTTALFLCAAFLTLVISIFRNDTSILLVGVSSFVSDPWYVRISGLWNVHLGIVLLWSTLLALFSSFYVIVSKRKSSDGVSRPTIGIQGFMLSGFLLYMIVYSSPFEPNLNNSTLLSKIAITYWHNLFFFIGYMLLSVAYALCIGILIEGKATSILLEEATPWLRLGWFSLATGLLLTLMSRVISGGALLLEIQEVIALIVLIALTSLLFMLPKIEEDRVIKKAVLLIDILLFFTGILGSLWYQKINLKTQTILGNAPSSHFLFVCFGVIFLFSAVIYAQRVIRSIKKTT
jgi:cytochrome c-type biogenesis protein CcmF